MKIALFAATAAVLLATPALASNTYQNTCSNIAFAYSGNDAAITAVCLKADGSPNATKLILQGISNQNGKLTQGSGASTFQKSCGNILIIVGNSPNTTLSALCRMSNGSSTATSLSLNGIANNNGNLVQQ
ncbi:MAG TPA: CVNH domain-containing protein [Pseudolabrys sp.]|uniref:CVNH domain-containing protein n=1 Tax=Pseudolabrys sp. TaxID=1960880 RepID=UPI002DDCF606|nr:CVNH domain-containing protein [Pseudolabrys sp.]HEV2630387.1 CVNH domain-containing protein [Pseudolabrys sp.]